METSLPQPTNNSSYYSEKPLDVFERLAREGTVSTVQVRYRKSTDDFLASVKRDVTGDRPEIAFGSGGSAEKAVSNLMALSDEGRARWVRDKVSIKTG